MRRVTIMNVIVSVTRYETESVMCSDCDHHIYRITTVQRHPYGVSILTQNLLILLLLLLLLLAAPTWLWGRCGRHNSPPASSVMDLVFRRSGGSHVSVDTVHPSLLRFSSLSSSGWYHLQSLSSDVVLVSLRGQTTSVSLSCTSLRYFLPSVSP